MKKSKMSSPPRFTIFTGRGMTKSARGAPELHKSTEWTDS